MSADDSKASKTVDEVTAILVRLQVEGQDTLFILLASDGLVNRLGTGSVNNTEHDMFIGKTTEPLFRQLRSQINAEWFVHSGIYTLPERLGKECDLTILFRFQGNSESGIGFRYGSESTGPPGDVAKFVMSAVHLTNPWFERQKKLPVQRRKPWWKFW